MKIQVSEPKFWGNEKLYVNDCLDTNWISSGGKYLEQFESAFCKFTNRKFAVSVSNGTAALEVAAYGIGIEPGDEVIMPSFTIISCAAAIIRLGGVPVFVDVEEDTWNINPEKIESAITENTKAIMMVHIYGHPADYNKIREIADKHELKIIEDSADTLGGKIKNRPTGTYSDISITSFYGSHVISCAGNGGMLMLNSKSVYHKAKILRSWGRLSSTIKDSENIKNRLNISLSGIDYDRKFVFSELGYNFEPSEIGAAFGNVQLKKFKRFSKIRNINFNYHAKFFKKFSDFFIIPKVLPTVSTNFLSYPIIMRENKKFSRKQLQVFMENSGVQTRPIFTGNLLRHPAFKFLNNKNNNVNSFPESDYIMKYGLLIGCHQGLDLKSLDKIHNIVKIFLNKIR